MPYSPLLMTLIFIKPGAGGGGETISLVAAKRPCRNSDTRLDVRRLGFGSRVIEATHPANTCVSTPSLCNANFAEVSLGNTTSEGETEAWKPLNPA